MDFRIEKEREREEIMEAATTTVKRGLIIIIFKKIKNKIPNKNWGLS